MTTSERAPFKPLFDSSAHRTPHWDDIPAINFSPHGGDGISPTNVTHAIEVRQACPAAYALTHNLPLGIVGSVWLWTRDAPSHRYRGFEPLYRHSWLTWNSCLAHCGGANESSA